ncbi:PD-(D/E)XK nuclease family protein [Pelomonas sp. V22]|uniref:PDDEXK-like family protein n=1 Tax=Pelomonas sp. V22 TaxID=2822139 RepID=UPI0024A9BE43|nr:PD-(D/E)XK nuclease family protein [Pelomonas sp. V22]MDI4634716.1 PD-(D/E)XK nuclease family protein [Pelomonas sp. V22]
MNNELLKFCSSPTLVDLLERVKSSNDILDLLTPRENQHSDLLAWCFNAREGHGQGDAILKDFLLAVFKQSTSSEAGDRIFGRGLTRDFVRAWTPARILTASFAGAFCLREYTLPKAAASSAGRRLDLVVIDPDNRILVVIENKAGARFRPGQLKEYVEGVQKALLSKAAFKDFHVAFVAMDRNWDPESDEELESTDDEFDPRWAHLDYGWLKPGAQRAELAVQRGNQGAALLLSYCRAQSGYESDEERQISRKAQELAIEFPSVVQEIKRVAQELTRPELWTPNLMRADNTDGQLLRLYMQHAEALDRLIDLPALQLLHGKLTEGYPILDHDDELIDVGRVWTGYRLPFDTIIPQVDDYWPLYLRIRHVNSEATGKPKFRVTLLWKPQQVPTEDRPRICAALGTEFAAASASGERINAMRLADELADGVDAAERVARSLIQKVQACISSKN